MKESKKDYSIHIFIGFVICMFLIIISSFVLDSTQKQNSDITTGSYIVEDKILDRSYVGGVIIEKHYFDICDADDMEHKKRILIPEEIYDKTEIWDIVKLKFYYQDSELIDVEVLE